MKKIAVAAAILASFAALSANAQVGAAANDATDAAQHKVDQKQAESKAKKEGPVGRAVDNVKADYHKHEAKASANKAKKELNNTAN